MNHVDNKAHQRLNAGFTMIELMLAMTFIAVLLLTIALTVIQIGTIYNKGLALKELNQAARDITADIRRTTPDAPQLVAADDFVTNAAGGRLCLGNSSYIWNTSKAIASTDPAMGPLRTAYEGSTTSYVRFAKVPDNDRIYCDRAGGGQFRVQHIRSEDRGFTQELLEAGEHKLGVNQVTLITPPASASTTGTMRTTLFTLSFVLGAGDVATMDDATQTSCKAPGVLGSDISYCNVQQFTIVFRVGSGV